MRPSDLMLEIGGEDSGSSDEVRLTAVHEAGHAIALCELNPGALESVTLSGGEDQGGRTSSLMRNSTLLAADLHKRLVGLLCGRAAEEEILGAPSSGSGGPPYSDLAIATNLAATASCALGLDGSGSLVWSGLPTAASLPAMLAADPAMKVRVKTILDAAYGDALHLVRRERAAIVAVADVLIVKRALTGEEVAAISALHPGVTEGRSS